MKGFTSTFFVCVFFLGISLGIFPAESTERKKLNCSLTMVALAAEKNPSLKLEHYEQETQRLAAEYARFWENPELSVEAGYKSSQISGLTYGVSLSQKIPFLFQASYFGDINSQKARMAQINYRYAVFMSKTSARELMRQIFYQEKYLRLLRAHREQLLPLIAHLRSVHLASASHIARKVSLDMYYRRLENSILSTENEIKNLRSRLDMIAPGLPAVDCEYAMPHKLKKEIHPENLEKFVHGRFMETNYHIVLLKEKEKLKTLENKFAMAARYPDVNISGYYQAEPGDPKDRFYGAGVSIPLPVIRRNKSEIMVTQNELEKIREEIKITENTYRQIIQADLHSLRIYLEMAGNYPDEWDEANFPHLVSLRTGLIRQQITTSDFMEYLRESMENSQEWIRLNMEIWNILDKMTVLTGEENLWENIYDPAS